MLGMIRNRKGQKRKGQSLVEYALIIAGVALIAAVGISVFGHKVSDMIDAVAVVLPGAHTGRQRPDLQRPSHRDDRRHRRGRPRNRPWTSTPLIQADGTGRLGGNVLGNSNNGIERLDHRNKPIRIRWNLIADRRRDVPGLSG